MEISPGMKVLISEDNVYTVSAVELNDEGGIWRIVAISPGKQMFHLSETECLSMRIDYLESLLQRANEILKILHPASTTRIDFNQYDGVMNNIEEAISE